MITLHNITAYAVEVAYNEWQSEILGYFSNASVAALAAKGSGWYGSDGKVKEVILHTDGEELFEVKRLGNFTDKAKEYKENLMKSIKSKLTVDELKILGL